MRKKKKPDATSFVTIPRSADADRIAEVAKKIGGTPEELTRLMTFVAAVEDEAIELQLAPPEVINGCITLIAAALSCLPPEQQATATSAIFESIWAHLGLPKPV
tara:strand:- start:369 stop:680 length:312 start_codon:yes stop_codon:yes gene_type:complete